MLQRVRAATRTLRFHHVRGFPHLRLYGISNWREFNAREWARFAEIYLITASEAVQLVLQVSTMGKGGEVFMLDMGEPVKVVEVARDLIRLSGLEPNRDIPIVFTRLRPGEKLFEELKLDGEGIKLTAHDKIKVLDGGEVSFNQVAAWLEELSALVNSKNVRGLVTKLKEIVPEYIPSKEILAQAELDRHDIFVSYDRARAGLTLQ